MTLKQFWTVLVKQWKVILLCFLVVGMGTFIKSKLTTPIYQSSALVQVSVGTGSTDLNDLLASNQLVQTEVILATTSPILTSVASDYNGLTATQLSTAVTATAKANSQLFEISVQDTSPSRAASIANDVAQTLIQQQTQQQVQAVPFNKEKPGQYLLLVQPAQINLKPVQPNVSLNTGLGLLAGLFLGMLLAIIINQVDTRVRTIESLTELTGWSVLASLGRTNASEKEDLLSPFGKTPNVEAYRMLRARIGLSAVSMSRSLRFIMVTSANQRDGKSTVAINLAISMAKSGRNTLLIDANLRNPTLHKKFNLPSEKAGLSNAVLKLSQPVFVSSVTALQQTPNLPVAINVSLSPYIHSVNVPNLRVMPAGPLPPNPSELLASKAMEILFAAVKNSEAEVVIFDTSAALGVSDTSTIAQKMDGTVVVVDIARADRKNLSQLQTLLAQTGTRVLGCIVNKARRDRKEVVVYESEEEPLAKAKHSGDEDSSSTSGSLTPLSEKQIPVTPTSSSEETVRLK